METKLGRLRIPDSKNEDPALIREYLMNLAKIMGVVTVLSVFVSGLETAAVAGAVTVGVIGMGKSTR